MDLSKEQKQFLADLLKKFNLMPDGAGKIIINVTPERTIGSIEKTSVYR